jgi:hypothetical protein
MSGHYTLYKVEDPYCGDSGGMSYTFKVKFDGQSYQDYDKSQNARPEVGKYIRVGSVYARTMQAQDWWQTNEIVEILEDAPKRVKFKTKSGSIYEWTNT